MQIISILLFATLQATTALNSGGFEIIVRVSICTCHYIIDIINSLHPLTLLDKFLFFVLFFFLQGSICYPPGKEGEDVVTISTTAPVS